MNSKNTTIIICCAGMGTRLGIGSTKSLIRICDEPIIIKLLKQLNDYDDIRIIVGYQSESVISVVNSYRADILYAFNYDYENTGPAASMWKGLYNSRPNVIVIDGDLVVEPSSLIKVLNFDGECIPYTINKTDEPIYLNVNNNDVIDFTTNTTDFIWSGIIKIKKEHIYCGQNYIYETILKSLPIKTFKINSMEIDTFEDYENVTNWVKNNFKGDI